MGRYLCLGLVALFAVSILVLTGPQTAEPSSVTTTQFSHGAVVMLRGTPHLWIADEQGVLHWGGDTRGLSGHYVAWGNRTEVSVSELQALTRGDPWLSAGLLKDGDPIYLVKWESHEAVPRLLHIQSIADVELFGINSSNYGRYVQSKSTWESRYGINAGSLQRLPLEAAASTAAPSEEELLRGKVLTVSNCGICHSISGTDANGVAAPSLDGISSRKIAGILPFNRENLIRWVQNPSAVKAGTQMPPYPLPEDQLRAIAVYLETLK